MKSQSSVENNRDYRSLPPRGAWIEMMRDCGSGGSRWSLPPRGAWIEILVKAGTRINWNVAPPAGSVD